MIDLNKRIIVFDGQVFQSTAWDRGMGKYSFNLLSAFSKSKDFKYHKAIIVFSKNKELPKDALKALKGLGYKFGLEFLDLEIPKIEPGENIMPIEMKNRTVLEDYIVSLKNEVDFVILSLMIDQYAAVFPGNSRKIILFYDLIPFQYSDRYGKMWSYHNYLHRFKTLFESDLILTISETVSDDLVLYTGIDKKIIRSLVGGPIERGHLKSSKPKKLDISEDFILMPSGNDLRKNNFIAVQAFEETIDRLNRKDLKLVITSHFDEKTKRELESISKNIIFTNNVSEEELKWLYENTKVLLFVSEYEGLGLPILEAVEVDKPIVCSNLTVFNEMSIEGFYYADEKNTGSISHALELSLNYDNFVDKKKSYKQVVNRYTWENTARQAVEAFSEIPVKIRPKNTVKPKIAIFAPDPRSYSAIGKVVMLSHHALSQEFEIDYYIESSRSDNPFGRESFLSSVANTYDARQFTAKKYSEYESVIYHIGNSELHIESIRNALHLPGHLIIHDTRLNDVFEHELKKYSYISEKRLLAERQLESHFSSERTSYLVSLVNASLGVFVHSDYAKKAVEAIKLHDNINVVKANLPASTPKREKLKINGGFSVGFGGIIHKAKGLNIIDSIATSPDLNDVDITLFGIPLTEPGELLRIESYSNVRIHKNLTDFEFESILSKMDVIISYRPTYNGETSLTVVEALRHGVIPIVRNVGWFSELPDNVAIKIDKEEQVVAAIKQLQENEKLLNDMKLAAKSYAEEELSYVGYAEKIKTISNNTEKEGFNYKIAKALHEKRSKEEIIKIIDLNTN
jgi:glycosyltransferase involved in cell wall biosynthesis